MDEKLARELAMNTAARMAEGQGNEARSAASLIAEAQKLYNWLTGKQEEGTL
jgi:hypothetical protein